MFVSDNHVEKNVIYVTVYIATSSIASAVRSELDKVGRIAWNLSLVHWIRIVLLQKIRPHNDIS